MGRRYWISWRVVVTGLTAALMMFAAGCTDIVEDSGVEWSGTIAGAEWRATATLEGDTVCLRRRAGDTTYGSCEQPVSESQALNVVGTVDRDLPVRVIVGQVAPSVTEVRVKMTGGDLRVLELRDLSGTDRRVFAAAFAQDEEPQVVEAEDDEGRVRSFGL